MANSLGQHALVNWDNGYCQRQRQDTALILSLLSLVTSGDPHHLRLLDSGTPDVAGRSGPKIYGREDNSNIISLAFY